MRIWQSIVTAVLSIFLLNNANALASNIINFNQLVKAVENGEDVRAIVHFDNCLVTQSALQTQLMRRFEGATTRFNFTQYFHAQKSVNNQLVDTVTTSMNIFIERPSGEILTLSGRLSVYEDNTAILHVDFFDPILHKQQLVVDWMCNISNGRDQNGLVLFNFS